MVGISLTRSSRNASLPHVVPPSHETVMFSWVLSKLAGFHGYFLLRQEFVLLLTLLLLLACSSGLHMRTGISRTEFVQ